MPKSGLRMLCASLCVIFMTAGVSQAHDTDRSLARTPPMGWNSWDAYGFTLDEGAYKDNATELAELSELGWRYAVIDEGWYMQNPFGADTQSRQYQLDSHGRLIPAANRFPSAVNQAGLRPLADWTHRLGLKLGIHIVRGIPKAAIESGGTVADTDYRLVDAADPSDNCPWDDGNYGVRDNAAGQAYYDSLIKLYASWKIDFLKVDCISNLPYRASEIRQIHSAIQRAGYPMVLSLSPGPTALTHAREVGHLSQMWRISNDIWDGWSFDEPPGNPFPIGVATAFDSLARWNPYARPGHWPDADMLPFGMLSPHPGWGEARTSRLSTDEVQSQFVLWAIAHSPLILGANLTQLDQSTRALISNPSLIDLNQGGWTSHPARLPPAHLNDLRAWIATRKIGKRNETVLALFNVGLKPITVNQPWPSLGVPGKHTAVENLLTGETLNNGQTIETRLPVHGSVVYRLEPAEKDRS